jgi:hypothetical protein
MGRVERVGDQLGDGRVEGETGVADRVEWTGVLDVLVRDAEITDSWTSVPGYKQGLVFETSRAGYESATGVTSSA